jgi:NitT/TauT family transport system permease protein/sulfonate transport system permease protein
MTAFRADLALRQRVALFLFVAVLLGAWALFAAQVPSYVLAGPTQVARQLIEFVRTFALAKHALFSFLHVTEAIAAAFAVGWLLALLAYYVPALDFAVHQRISPAVNSFPGVGWIMLAIIWFGIGDVTVVFSIGMTLLPFVLINLREGFNALGAENMEMARSFTRNGRRAFLLVILPYLYPFMFATLRICFGVAWKVTLTAELFGGRNGLGYLFNLARQSFDTALILVVIIIIISSVYVLDRLVFKPVQQRLERQHAE